MTKLSDKTGKLYGRIPGKANIIGVLVLWMFVWFVLPHVFIGGIYPFSTTAVKYLMMLLAAGVWIFWRLLNQIQKHRINVIPVLMANGRTLWQSVKIQSAWLFNNSQNYVRQLKIRARHDRDKRRLGKLPWYIFLGDPNAGKKNLISNLGLYFAQAKHFGVEAEKYIRQFPDYDWWFSEQAVFIDTMNHVKEEDSQSWKRFIRLLAKERKNKPVNGIILAFSLANVLLYSNQNRQKFIQDVCLYIREIHLKFKSQVPVYLIFTKVDLVEGFMEFFNDLSKDELRQVWGMTVPLALSDDANRVLQFYHDEYSAMVKNLRNRVLWSFDTERSPRGRELIHSFPQQMQLLRRPIETFISELFSGVRYPKALQLRGLYFCSSRQEGETHDFLLQAMSKKFQLVPPVVQKPQRMGECYFIRRLFHEVIYPEAKILGESERSRKIRKFSYSSFRIAAPLLLLCTLILMHQGYKENLEAVAMAENSVAQISPPDFSISPGSDPLVAMLYSLDQLNAVKNSYSENLPLGMRTLFATTSIRNHVDDAMQRFLGNVYLPCVAAQLETRLNHSITNQDLLYATLRGYLAFDADSETDQNAIKAPMEYDWMRRYKANPKVEQQLQYYLMLSLQQPVNKLPLDEALINRIRDQLGTIIPSERAYGLLVLRSDLGDLPNLTVNSVTGSYFTDIFETKKQELIIPALYTAIGFKKLFINQYRAIAEEVAQDNREIGLADGIYETRTTDQIASAMKDEYGRLYVGHWYRILKDIHIKPFASLQMAVAALQILTGPQSPMDKLLALVDANTHQISDADVPVASDFHAINQFQLDTSSVSWTNTQDILNHLQDYLMNIQNSADRNQAEYNAILETIKTGKSPILDLKLEANKVPEPIKGWLNNIADNSWNVLIMGAHDYVNTLWQTGIMQFYDANIKGRYPVAPHGEADIAISDFNQFFAPKGRLIQFFNQYLAPFVQTDQQSWTQYQIQGLGFQMSQTAIDLFQRAMIIQNEYFANGNQTADLSFSIKPRILDVNASSASLVMGERTINYSHGPQDTTTLNWPSSNSQEARIVLSTFNGAQFSRRATGPWAFFRLLDFGGLTSDKTGNYQFMLNMNGHTVGYDIFGSADQSIYGLTALKQFYLPENIVETGENK